MVVPRPIPGFVSGVGFAVLGLPGNGAETAPAAPPLGVGFSLLLFGKLLVGNVFFHVRTSCWFPGPSYLKAAGKG